ncbi:MAG TPA: hypothetical protein PK156_45200, partial [Polyangium sp.]|nr:hypothetical protein [Polyangium sp.]
MAALFAFVAPALARFSRTGGTPNSPAARAQTAGPPPSRENSVQGLNLQWIQFIGLGPGLSPGGLGAEPLGQSLWRSQ